MFKLLVIFIGLMFIFSCSEYKVYQFRDELGTDQYYVLDKNELEIFMPERVNISYYKNIYNGFSKKELQEDGSSDKKAGFSEFYKIEKVDSGFIYNDIKNNSKLFLPILKTKDTCFNINTFLEINRYDNFGYANGKEQPWDSFYGKKIQDTIFFFNSQKPVDAIYVELAPYHHKKNVSVDDINCEYTNPIEIIIERETGVPLAYRHRYASRSLMDNYHIVFCLDYKSTRISRKKLRKLLW